MADLKTQRNDSSMDAFIQSVADERRRNDCHELLALMQTVTGEEPQMWGENIIGLGSFRYRYASGHTGEWPLVSFSPRKQNLTLYIVR